jgi:hypothetical protein
LKEEIDNFLKSDVIIDFRFKTKFS